MVKNDMGNMVVAIGAPGSMARVQCEHPALINTLNECYDFSNESKQHGLAVAELLIKQSGITSKLERESLLKVTKYSKYF